MKLPIVKYGNPILRAKGKRVEEVDERIRTLAADMLETMHAANGIGLAAQQVGAALQLTVLDISPVEDRPSLMTLNGTKVDPALAMPLVLLNPRLELDEETVSGNEGCLSFPDINADIDRAVSVRVEAETLEGETVPVSYTHLTLPTILLV